MRKMIGAQLVASTHSATSRRFPRALVVILTVMLAVAALPPSASTQEEWAPPRTVFIPESGQTIDGYFLDIWRAWGGTSSFGNPITPELTENGRIVQYYEFARLEYVPDDPNGQYVHFGEIGRELRPVTLFRARPSIVRSDRQEDVVSHLADEMRAWLPVREDEVTPPVSGNWRYVAETQHSIIDAFKDFWEVTGEETYLGYPITEEYEIKGAFYQVFERGKLAWTEELGTHMLPIGTALAKQYGPDMEPQTSSQFPDYSEALFVPPPPPPFKIYGGERWIQINLSTQYLIAWDGNIPVAETYVSTGRPGFDTPTGTFYINSKVESQTMAGVLGGEYYNVPDVPWVMYFTGRGHALHGTYWHENFGAVMSHGCVNLPLDFAKRLYEWAPPGTRVVISY
jgi:hypothetical protein